MNSFLSGYRQAFVQCPATTALEFSDFTEQKSHRIQFSGDYSQMALDYPKQRDGDCESYCRSNSHIQPLSVVNDDVKHRHSRRERAGFQLRAA